MENFSNDITICVKTFIRKKSLWTFLQSVNQYYPELPIIVVDDSPINYKRSTLAKFPNLKIDYIVCKFDVGLSKGRNLALKRVRTEYFLLCDDDFQIDSETDLYRSVRCVIDENIDLLGGELTEVFPINSLYAMIRFLTGKRHRVSNPKLTKSEIIGRKLVVSPIVVEDYSLVNGVDYVNNFFIAKTSIVKKIGGWQPESMKLYEHGLFYLNANLKSVRMSYSNKLKVNSVRYTPLIYFLFRFRPIKKYISIAKTYKDFLYRQHQVDYVESVDSKGISSFYYIGD